MLMISLTWAFSCTRRFVFVERDLIIFIVAIRYSRPFLKPFLKATVAIQYSGLKKKKIQQYTYMTNVIQHSG